MAIGIKLFGPNEFGIRFSGIFWGGLTILLLYIAGKDMFDRRVGILSAVIYTFMPLTINFSQFARYPSQVQFFSLLTTYLFYKSISGKDLSAKYIYLTAFSFIMTYLSWEGSGFLLPSFLVALLLYKREDFSWIKNKHLWYATIIISFIIFYQLSLRYIYANEIKMMIGSGVGDITLAPQWGEPGFDPYYYINNFFLVDNLYLVSLFFALGILLFLKERVMSFFCGIVVPITIMMTFLIEIKALRYMYYIIPMLLLGGTFVFLKFLDYFLSQRTVFSIYIGRFIKVLAFAVIFLTSNDFILNASYGKIPATTLKTKHYSYDLNNRRAIIYLQENIRPGDRIISNWPHVFTFFLGRCEYYTENRLALPVAILRNEPIAGSRVSGAPLVYDIDDLRDILGKHERLWLIFTTFSTTYFDKEFIDFIKKDAHAVYEDYSISIYLWDR